MICCSDREPLTLTHYTGENKNYHLDLINQITGRAITSITSVVCTDSTVVIGDTSIINEATPAYDQDGNAITIAANTGVTIQISGGTATGYDVEYSSTLTITFTTSEGTEQAVVRLFTPM